MVRNLSDMAELCQQLQTRSDHASGQYRIS